MKHLASFLAGFATMAAIGVLGSAYMARKHPETFNESVNLYRP